MGRFCLEDYLYWQTQDRKTLRRINQLLLDIDRLVYRIVDDRIEILQCRSHYGGK